MARPSSKAKRLGQSVFFVDESGFYPLAGVVRAYASRGQVPLLHEWLTRDHLSVMAVASGLHNLRVAARN